jgi:hypothetical protein
MVTFNFFIRDVSFSKKMHFYQCVHDIHMTTHLHDIQNVLAGKKAKCIVNIVRHQITRNVLFYGGAFNQAVKFKVQTFHFQC